MGKLVGERKALAAAVLGFYMSIFFLVSLQAPEGWAGAFGALAGIYAVGFVGLVAEYFWARWFAIGLGISGLISAAMSVWQIGPEPVLVFYGITHGLISLALWSGQVAGAFDGRKEWRERYHLDENATHRLGKSIIRVGVSLPYIVLYALAPKQPEGLWAVAAVVLVGAGVYGLLRMRGWALAALAGGALALGASLPGALAAFGVCGGISASAALFGVEAVSFQLPALMSGVAGLGLLVAAISPFAKPVIEFLKRRDD